MIKVNEAVVVEGKHDRVKLSSFLDAVIIETNGFRIFKDHEKLEMLRGYAETCGLIVLSDSDSAGLVIRNYLSGCIPVERIRHIYIPPVEGKERRKAAYSKEGLLGVEGLSEELLTALFEQAGVVIRRGELFPVAKPPASESPVTIPELYELGLLGKENSSQRRKELLRELNLPLNLSTKRLLEYGNTVLSPNKLRAYCAKKD